MVAVLHRHFGVVAVCHGKSVIACGPPVGPIAVRKPLGSGQLRRFSGSRGGVRLLGIRGFAADCIVAVARVGGPSGEEGLPQGTVFISVATAEETVSARHQFAGDPSDVIVATVQEALTAIVQRLRAGTPGSKLGPVGSRTGDIP